MIWTLKKVGPIPKMVEKKVQEVGFQTTVICIDRFFTNVNIIVTLIPRAKILLIRRIKIKIIWSTT